MTNTLSPLTMSCLLRQADPCAALKPDAPRSMRKRPEEVVMYRCPECGDLHDVEEDAEDCCAADDADHVRCPVCGSVCGDHHDAANCCLWRDLDVAARFRIAMRVEAGAEWLDAIEAEADR